VLPCFYNQIKYRINGINEEDTGPGFCPGAARNEIKTAIEKLRKRQSFL